jgi:hypothetical protein
LANAPAQQLLFSQAFTRDPGTQDGALVHAGAYRFQRLAIVHTAQVDRADFAGEYGVMLMVMAVALVENEGIIVIEVRTTTNPKARGCLDHENPVVAHTIAALL